MQYTNTVFLKQGAMNANTQKFLQQIKTASNFYAEQQENIDHEKAYEHLLSIFSAVFKSYKRDYEESIEYITETLRIHESKRVEIEKLSLKIRTTIKAYHMINPLKLDEAEIDCLNETVLDYNIDELRSHYQLLNKMFNPIKGALLSIGITSAMLKELEAKIADLDTALPIDIESIEAKREKFNMASKAIQLLERLEFDGVEAGKRELVKH